EAPPQQGRPRGNPPRHDAQRHGNDLRITPGSGGPRRPETPAGSAVAAVAEGPRSPGASSEGTTRRQKSPVGCWNKDHKRQELLVAASGPLAATRSSCLRGEASPGGVSRPLGPIDSPSYQLLPSVSPPCGVQAANQGV